MKKWIVAILLSLSFVVAGFGVTPFEISIKYDASSDKKVGTRWLKKGCNFYFPGPIELFSGFFVVERVRSVFYGEFFHEIADQLG